MVGTIKKAIRRLVEGHPKKWAEKYEAFVAGYCRRPSTGGDSPFELLLCDHPSLTNEEVQNVVRLGKEGGWVVWMAFCGNRAAYVTKRRREKS